MELKQNVHTSADGFIALATAPLARYFDFSGRSRHKDYFSLLTFVTVSRSDQAQGCK
jgi:hypothetical protein